MFLSACIGHFSITALHALRQMLHKYLACVPLLAMCVSRLAGNCTLKRIVSEVK